MIGYLRTRVRKQPINALYFEFENELKFYNLEARFHACACVSEMSRENPLEANISKIKDTISLHIHTVRPVSLLFVTYIT